MKAKTLSIIFWILISLSTPLFSTNISSDSTGMNTNLTGTFIYANGSKIEVLYMQYGQSVQLNFYENGKLITQGINWISEEIVDFPVTPKGVVTARNIGTSVIKATHNGNSASIYVACKDLSNNEKKFWIKPKISISEEGQVAKLSVGTIISSITNINWKIINTNEIDISKVAITKTGLFTVDIRSLVAGRILIEANSGYFTDTATIIFQQKQVSQLSLQPESITLRMMEKSKMPLMIFLNNQPLNDSLYWKSDNSNIAVMLPKNYIQAIFPGETVINGIYNGNKASLKINVIPSDQKPNLVINPRHLFVNENQVDKLSVTVNTHTISSEVYYHSLNTEVVKVSSNGYIYGIKPGNALIVGEHKYALSDTVLVTVLRGSDTISAPPLFEIYPEKISIKAGRSIVIPSNIDSLIRYYSYMDSGKWISENPDIVRIEGCGTITALHSGSTRILATIGKQSDIVLVEVEQDNGGNNNEDNIELIDIELKVGERISLRKAFKELPNNTRLMMNTGEVIALDMNMNIYAINKGIAVLTAFSPYKKFGYVCRISVKDNLKKEEKGKIVIVQMPNLKTIILEFNTDLKVIENKDIKEFIKIYSKTTSSTSQKSAMGISVINALLSEDARQLLVTLSRDIQPDEALSITMDNGLYPYESGVPISFSFEIGRTGTSLDNDTNFEPSFNLFPNPADNFINITSEQSIKGITVYNISGMTVYQNNKINSPQILLNLSDFPNGTYQIEIKSVNGEKTIRKFLINQ